MGSDISHSHAVFRPSSKHPLPAEIPTPDDRPFTLKLRVLPKSLPKRITYIPSKVAIFCHEPRYSVELPVRSMTSQSHSKVRASWLILMARETS